MPQAAIGATACRAVTPEEIRHYREHGWVKLQGFLQPQIVQLLLANARERMGEEGDTTQGISQPYFTVAFGGGLQNPEMKALIEQLGQNAKALMARGAVVGVRYFADFFAPKLPASKQTENAGNGPTAFHQDFITFGVDRSGGMTFWIPLEAYGPDAGTMSFVSGSHRQGVLGSYRAYGDGDALDAFPELRELPMSEAMHYQVGDITVHSHLTIHGAGINCMDTPRWSYIVLAQPGDVCWSGAPSEAFDPTGMEVNQPLDDERFPLIG